MSVLRASRVDMRRAFPAVLAFCPCGASLIADYHDPRGADRIGHGVCHGCGADIYADGQHVLDYWRDRLSRHVARGDAGSASIVAHKLCGIAIPRKRGRK